MRLLYCDIFVLASGCVAATASPGMWPRRHGAVAGKASGAVPSAPPSQPDRALHPSFASVNAMAPPQNVRQIARALDDEGALPDHGSESEGGTTDSVDVMPGRWAAVPVPPGSNGAVARREQGWTWEVL